jgi:hypothetical protein
LRERDGNDKVIKQLEPRGMEPLPGRGA